MTREERDRRFVEAAMERNRTLQDGINRTARRWRQGFLGALEVGVDIEVVSLAVPKEAK